MGVATSTLIVAGVAAAGAGASVYGANKAAKSSAAATAANKASVEGSDALTYQRWLESQGVGADGKAVNTWLPRHMTVNTAVGKPRRFRRAGTGAAAPAQPAADNSGVGQFAL